MAPSQQFDVIIVGGSYAGLSAALSLGRALRNVLVVDSNHPCNRQTPHSHNFLSHDGKKPQEISALSKADIGKYPTVSIKEAWVETAWKKNDGFEIALHTGETFSSKKLLFASGLRDLMPEIPGFKECWGISILHCPYCHGYEVKNEPTGVLGNGKVGFEITKMISHWTKDLTLFTNGTPTLSKKQLSKLKKHGIKLIETELEGIEHTDGYLEKIVLKDGSAVPLKAIYTKTDFEQHSSLPQALGCELTDKGLIKVNMYEKTTVEGVYACGDCASFGRAVSIAVSKGAIAGMAINKDLIEACF